MSLIIPFFLFCILLAVFTYIAIHAYRYMRLTYPGKSRWTYFLLDPFFVFASLPLNLLIALPTWHIFSLSYPPLVYKILFGQYPTSEVRNIQTNTFVSSLGASYYIRFNTSEEHFKKLIPSSFESGVSIKEKIDKDTIKHNISWWDLDQATINLSYCDNESLPTNVRFPRGGMGYFYCMGFDRTKNVAYVRMVWYD